MDESRAEKVIFSKKKGKTNGHIELNGIGELRTDQDWEGFTDEDDVFLDNPTNDDDYASKPLMFPRKHAKVKNRRPNTNRRRKVVRLICCSSLAVTAITLIALTINQYLNKTTQKQRLKPQNKQHLADVLDIEGCNHIEVEDVWVSGFPKLLTESSFRLLDVNEDGMQDIILGFATGVDGYSIPSVVCDIYFDGNFPCFGGILALDGKSGIEIWRHYAEHELFGINCNADLNQDGVHDCLGGGRAGAFHAVNGRNGDLLWKFDDPKVKDSVMNLYTPHIIEDVDEDGVVDILAIHGGDPLSEPGSVHRLSGRIVFFSGKSGKVLSWTGVPDKKESYYSPQILTRADGTSLVLFGTGGETHGGSLWVIDLIDLYKGQMSKAKPIYKDAQKGVMTPPVLLDLTGDGIEDIVMSMFNSTVIAFDGKSFTVLWNFSFPMSESYNTPAPGFYNNDTVPDFLIKYAHGPGFPLYYYSETTVIDGRLGAPLLEKPLRDTVGAQASPLTISVEGHGNDIFLYWISDCEGHEGQGGAYRFVEGTNVHEQSRSDFCHLRYNTEGFSKLIAKSRHTDPKGVTVYYSGSRKTLERTQWINTTREAINFIRKHPERYREYMQYQLAEKEEDKSFNKFKNLAAASKQEDKPIYNTLPANSLKRVSSKKGHSYFDDYDDNPVRTPPNSKRYRKKGHQTLRDDNQRENNRKNPHNKLYENRLFSKRRKRANKDVEKKISKTDNTKRKYTRFRRHVGPHDNEGIQRLLSTGTLAPTNLQVDHPKYNNSIDIVFATYWFFPAKTQAILPEDQQCISNKLAEEAIRFRPNSKYYGMDHDEYQHVITQECLQNSGHGVADDNTYESQSSYNPYNVHMGQMSVYRLRLTCTCGETTRRCSKILPFEKQQWTSYMGNHGDSHWKPRISL